MQNIPQYRPGPFEVLSAPIKLIFVATRVWLNSLIKQ